jgi:tetratricopeptide (TPR) repeat protein
MLIKIQCKQTFFKQFLEWIYLQMKQKNNLQITLAISFITLFLNSFNASADALSDKISACNAALNKADVSSALTSAEEILKLQSNNRDGLLCKGRALGAQGKYDDALSALSMAEKQSQPGFEQILAHIFIGNLHKNNGKFSEAIASYETSIKICDAEKNMGKYKRVDLQLIGDAHTQNKDLNAALSSYTAASKLAMNDNERAEDFERLASTYNALGKNNEAIEYQLKATMMQDKSGTRELYANASVTLGRFYESAKDYPAAENTYRKLLKFSKDNGSAYYETLANYGIARNKAATGDTASAKTMLAEASTMAKSIGEADLVAEIEATLKKLAN